MFQIKGKEINPSYISSLIETSSINFSRNNLAFFQVHARNQKKGREEKLIGIVGRCQKKKNHDGTQWSTLGIRSSVRNRGKGNKIDWNLGWTRYTSGWNFFTSKRFIPFRAGAAVPSSKHFGQPKETHLPADKHGESPWRRRSRTVLALPRGEVERGMCLGLFALQDNIPSLLKDESRERSAAILSRLSFPPSVSPIRFFLFI